MRSASRHIALVETSDALPGLLPFQAWDTLATADEVLVRDREAHPSGPYLHAAGLDLVEIDPAPLERGDLDLSRPGSADDRRLAKALVARSEGGNDPVFLLGPQDAGLPKALAGMAAEHDVEIELVFLAPLPPGTELLRLAEVMRTLRDPTGGCPWDLQQTHASLAPHVLEEAYELVEAIERGHDVDLVEELGDVLLQVVFHAQVADDRRAFDIDDVARRIVDKLVHRHPHVFAEGDATTAAEVQENWDRLKAVEKGRTGPFEGVPSAMAGLMLLETLQRKAARHGVVLPAPDDPAGAVGERLRVASAAGDDDARQSAIGALLAEVVALARTLDVDPEGAARRAATEFRSRTEAALRRVAAQQREPADVAPQEWAEILGDSADGT